MSALEETADLLQKLGHSQAEFPEQALGPAALRRPHAVHPELPCGVACAAVELPERWTDSLRSKLRLTKSSAQNLVLKRLSFSGTHATIDKHPVLPGTVSRNSGSIRQSFQLQLVYGSVSWRV